MVHEDLMTFLKCHQTVVEGRDICCSMLQWRNMKCLFQGTPGNVLKYSITFYKELFSFETPRRMSFFASNALTCPEFLTGSIQVSLHLHIKVQLTLGTIAFLAIWSVSCFVFVGGESAAFPFSISTRLARRLSSSGWSRCCNCSSSNGCPWSRNPSGSDWMENTKIKWCLCNEKIWIFLEMRLLCNGQIYLNKVLDIVPIAANT